MGNRQLNIVKESIYEAMSILLRKKPLSEISISEITEKAGVSRISYYRNFSSKLDILDQYLLEGINEYKKKHGLDKKKLSLKENLFHTFYVFKEQACYLSAEKNPEIIRLIYQFSFEYIEEAIKKHLKSQHQSCTAYDISFYIGGITRVLSTWIHNNYVEDIPVLVELTYQKFSFK